MQGIAQKTLHVPYQLLCPVSAARPDPDHAQSDGAQSLDLPAFERLLASLRKLAEPLGKRIN